MKEINSIVKKDDITNMTDYSDITFSEKCNIHNAEFEMISFLGCVFEKEFSIESSKIGLLSFVNCQFNDKIYINIAIEDLFFAENICEKETLFRVSNNKYLGLVDCEFKHNCEIDSNNENTTFTTYNSIFNKILTIRNVTANSFGFDSNKVNGNLIIDNFNIKNTDIFSLRLIKNSLLKNSNKVEALLYHKMEMDLLLRQTSNFWEKLLLLLNKVSNNHGTSWKNGFVFTTIITLFFYTLYVLSLKERMFYFEWKNISGFFEALNYHVKHISEFFIVSHKLDFMNLRLPNGLSYLIDIVSRIFIGYGIYQTIQAFRKYGKNI